MPDVLLKDLPVALHRRLKEEAKLHYRSMNQEIRKILEMHLGGPEGRSGVPEVEPFVFSEPLTDAVFRELSGGRVTTKARKIRIEDLVVKMPRHYRPKEDGFGPAQGKEAW